MFLNECMRYLGVIYHLGEGVKKNLTKAVEWSKKAADKGNPKAMIYIGHAYVKGEGIGWGRWL